MEAFDYLAPRTLEDVYSALSNGKRTALLAGGTDLIIQLREGRKTTDQVIDLKHISELMTFASAAGGSLDIGAAVPLAELYENADVQSRFPCLIDAASIIGGIAIQGRASLGGNVCNASPAADSSPALMVLGATLVIGSKSGTRELPVEDFFVGPGRNALQPGELLLRIRIPAPALNSGAFYLRFIPRNEMDIAVASAGASLQLSADGTRIDSARVALGAVGPTPLMVPEAATALKGQAPGPEAFNAAADAAARTARPISDMRGSAAQRTHLSRVLTIRALEGALQRARENR